MGGNQASIVAIITTKRDYVQGGGAPVFITENQETLQKLSMSIENIMDASAHELDPETMIIVIH